MYHPLLLQPDVIRDLPELLDDRCRRRDEPAVLSYRSEGFAEDLSGDDDPATGAAQASRTLVALLVLAPVCLALAGASLSLLAA